MEFMLHPSKENPNDRVTTNELGEIILWEVWSDYFQDFMAIDIKAMKVKYPTAYKVAEDHVKDRFIIEHLPIERMIG